MGSNEEKNLFFDGTEPPFLFAHCAKHNCTLDIWYEEDFNDWGGLDGNGSGNGIFGAVARRTADMTVSSMGVW